MAVTFEEAKRKARYGHKDWISYRTRDGETVCERFCTASVKRALLAVGTGGTFTVIAASTAIGHRYNWAMGLLAIRNAKYFAA